MHINQVFHSPPSLFPCIGVFSILFMDVKKIALFFTYKTKQTKNQPTQTTKPKQKLELI